MSDMVASRLSNTEQWCRRSSKFQKLNYLPSACATPKGRSAVAKRARLLLDNQREGQCGSTVNSAWAGDRVNSCAAASTSYSSDGLTWDVLGIGQAMVDFSACVDDSFLRQIGIDKGGRRIISVEERAQILELLSGGAYQICAGGSLANTLANLARLGQAEMHSSSASSSQPLRVAAASIAGSDVLGKFHQAEQNKAGVHTLAAALPESCTGTVIVLTTPDANRTFLSYLGTSQELQVDDMLRHAIKQSRLVALEGYVWEMPNAANAIQQVIDLAHSCGAMVVMTAGDANVVRRHRTEVWHALKHGVDIYFANRAEAEALLDQNCSAQDAALALGPHCSMAIVTDGANGSTISAMGHLQVIPPYWATKKPLDTCGAGDAYAAGLIYGWLSDMDPSCMGRCAARVASAVIAKHGGALNDDDAATLVNYCANMPAYRPDMTNFVRMF